MKVLKRIDTDAMKYFLAVYKCLPENKSIIILEDSVNVRFKATDLDNSGFENFTFSLVFRRNSICNVSLYYKEEVYNSTVISIYNCYSIADIFRNKLINIANDNYNLFIYEFTKDPSEKLYQEETMDVYNYIKRKINDFKNKISSNFETALNQISTIRRYERFIEYIDENRRQIELRINKYIL